MRLEGQAKGGFFPTPSVVVEQVARLLRVPGSGRDGVIRLLDPCCGTGAALAQLAGLLAELAGNTAVETYGVELHRERHEQATQVLDHALSSDAFQVSVANGAFQLLWLNPPYDYDDEKLRQEHKFLLHCTRYLAPGGLLVFLVPQVRLSVSARYLASHYTRLACHRFPDPEYAAYRQVVLTGTKKCAPSADADTEAQVRHWAEGELSPPPADRDVAYPLPAARPGEVLFSTRSMDPKVAVVEARQSGLWASPALRDRLWPQEAPSARPLMPLRKGHLAMLIAAGFLNNLCLESDGERLLVKGRTRKEFVLAESDPETETYREVLHTSVVALDLESGGFIDIQA